MKQTQEKVNVTRLLSFLPVSLSSAPPPSGPSSTSMQRRRELTASFSFHPHCCFSPPANLFLCLGRLFSASHTCRTETAEQRAKEGGREGGRKRKKEEATSSAHPPKTAVVLKEACVCMCVSCQAEHVCMCVSLRVSSAYLRAGRPARPAGLESDGHTLSGGRSCSLRLCSSSPITTTPKASRLR